jgi:hypothetical protein
MNKPMPLRLAASCMLCDPDRDWHTETCHPVDDVACDLRFGPLTGQNPSVETPANDGLVAIHRGLNQAPTAVARIALPGDASMLRDRREMSVALRCMPGRKRRLLKRSASLKLSGAG